MIFAAAAGAAAGAVVAALTAGCPHLLCGTGAGSAGARAAAAGAPGSAGFATVLWVICAGGRSSAVAASGTVVESAAPGSEGSSAGASCSALRAGSGAWHGQDTWAMTMSCASLKRVHVGVSSCRA